MIYTWRCPKCFRYLSHIETNVRDTDITQRTICPRCKSENKITLNTETVVISCGFSKKFNSNLTRTEETKAPNTKTILVEKVGTEICSLTRIVIINDRKDR